MVSRLRNPANPALRAQGLMDSVIALCGQRGERLTSLRREVLTILEKLDQPRTAYQILGFINKSVARNLPR